MDLAKVALMALLYARCPKTFLVLVTSVMEHARHMWSRLVGLKSAILRKASGLAFSTRSGSEEALNNNKVLCLCFF